MHNATDQPPGTEDCQQKVETSAEGGKPPSARAINYLFGQTNKKQEPSTIHCDRVTSTGKLWSSFWITASVPLFCSLQSGLLFSHSFPNHSPFGLNLSPSFTWSFFSLFSSLTPFISPPFICSSFYTRLFCHNFSCSHYSNSFHHSSSVPLVFLIASK